MYVLQTRCSYKRFTMTTKSFFIDCHIDLHLSIKNDNSWHSISGAPKIINIQLCDKRFSALLYSFWNCYHWVEKCVMQSINDS